MAYKFKVWTDGVREVFGWGTVENEYDKKLVHKKDFEFTQSLLALLDLNVDDLYEPTGNMGKQIQALYSKTDGSGDTFNLRRAFDSLARKHIFFEFLRIDWQDRLDRYERKEFEGAVDRLMRYKDITWIPSQLATWQNHIRDLLKKALDGTARDKTVQKAVADLYRGYDGSLDLFNFRPLSTGFERVDGSSMAEVLYPRSIADMVDFFLREVVRREVTFKPCKNCGKYFPSTAHGNTEFCNRIYADGKTCREIGSMAKWKEKVAASPAILLYNKHYKTRFSRIRAGKITREVFQEWAAKARNYRDKVTNGEMPLEQFQAWLDSGRWV
ncbi:MAG: DUF6076 domain-containing protein [Oscillospiraceae bacterium]|nr:DUF6076 domain-containing protein [Oscillospiraceae bacterium]